MKNKKTIKEIIFEALEYLGRMGIMSMIILTLSLNAGLFSKPIMFMIICSVMVWTAIPLFKIGMKANG